jgi:hypothetical protein
MKNTAIKVLLFGAVLAPAVVYGQGSGPTTATIITKDMIDTISKQIQDRPTVDENAMVVDLGYEHFSVGVIHRGSTRNPPPRPANAAAPAGPPPEPCGRQVASVPADAIPGGITHDFQTEAYYIIGGAGTAFVDGYIVNGRKSPMAAPGGPNGPTCGGASVGSHKVDLKPGDIMIAPPNTVHGWADIPDHVEYLSFRPSQQVMQAGWVNPRIEAMVKK